FLEDFLGDGGDRVLTLVLGLLEGVGGALGAVPVAPLGDVVLDVLEVAVATADDVGLVVPGLAGQFRESLAVDVQEDIAVVRGMSGATVADEELGGLTFVLDVTLGA